MAGSRVEGLSERVENKKSERGRGKEAIRREIV